MARKPLLDKNDSKREDTGLRKHRTRFENLALRCTRIGRDVFGKNMGIGRLGPGHGGSSMHV